MAYLEGSIEAADFYCAAFNAEKACFKAADDDERKRCNPYTVSFLRMEQADDAVDR